MSEQGGPAYRTMHEFAEDERPRERLLRHGPQVVSDAELLAIILRSGTRGQNVVDLARAVLREAGGLAGLVRADAAQLQLMPGLGPAKAAEIAAAIEIGRRMRDLTPEARPLLTSAPAIYALLGARMYGLTRETLFVMALDSRGRLLAEPAAINGGIGSVQARVADVFRDAIVRQATTVVLAHNHPSGDPRPSAQDLAVTADMIRAGKLFGIKVLDHLVVGLNRYVSMKDEGLAFRPEPEED